jgi:hypothetical protein
MPKQVARSEAQGRGKWGRLSLLTFFGEAKKVSAPPGAYPGSRTRSRHGAGKVEPELEAGMLEKLTCLACIASKFSQIKR